MVRIEPTLDGITTIPGEVHRFTDLAAYKAWVRQNVEGLQFEFYPDNKVFLRFPEGTSPLTSGSLTWEFNWEQIEGGWYRLVESGPYIPLPFSLGQSVSHRLKMSDANSAVCQYQVEWSESGAPRSPLVLEKTWE